MKDTGRPVKAGWTGILTCPTGSLDLSQAGSLRKGQDRRWLMDIRTGEKRDLSLRAGLADGQES